MKKCSPRVQRDGCVACNLLSDPSVGTAGRCIFLAGAACILITKRGSVCPGGDHLESHTRGDNGKDAENSTITLKVLESFFISVQRPTDT